MRIGDDTCFGCKIYDFRPPRANSRWAARWQDIDIAELGPVPIWLADPDRGLTLDYVEVCRGEVQFARFGIISLAGEENVMESAASPGCTIDFVEVYRPEKREGYSLARKQTDEMRIRSSAGRASSFESGYVVSRFRRPKSLRSSLFSMMEDWVVENKNMGHKKTRNLKPCISPRASHCSLLACLWSKRAPEPAYHGAFLIERKYRRCTLPS